MYPKKEQLNTQRAYRNYFNFKTELFLRFIFKKIIETNNFDSILHVLNLTTDRQLRTSYKKLCLYKLNI